MIRSKNAPLIIGVTGHMDLREEDEQEINLLKERVRVLFRFLKCTKREQVQCEKELRARRKGDLDALLALLRKPGEDAAWDRPYKAALKNWPDLQQTPIVVLSSLAPGADTLVADVALEQEFQDVGFSVLGALPFPRHVYRDASTFVRDGEPGNDKRQRDYDRLLELMDGQRQVGGDPTFEVLVSEDVEKDKWLPWPKREQKFCDDRDADDDTQGQRRYLAAGEYMAAYAHLMVAISDAFHEDDKPPGTAAIVEARRGGMTPGLLPTTSNLSLPHGGPVLSLYTRREKNPKSALDSIAPLRWLHPFDSAPRSALREVNQIPDSQVYHRSGSPNLDDDDPNWQRTALTLFCRVVRNLSEFNLTNPPSEGFIRDELKQGLTYTVSSEAGQEEPGIRCFSTHLHQARPDFHTGLSAVSAFRSRSTREANKLSTESKRTLCLLFISAMVGAGLLHLFAHWHPQGHKNQGHGRELASDHKETDSWEVSARTIQGYAALTAGVIGLLWFWCKRPQRYGERAHDYRALSEGLRVQFFWNLVGIGKSASANYMQRQRGELDWIRGVIRGTSFPYHRWRDWFDALDPNEKVTALRCALYGWVTDQKNYFHKTGHLRHQSLHIWHKIGSVLALAGLWAAASLCYATKRGHKADLEWADVKLVGIAFSILMVVWLLQWGWRLVRRLRGFGWEQQAHREAHAQVQQTKKKNSPEPQRMRKRKCKERACAAYKWFMKHAVPTVDSQELAQLSSWKRRGWMAYNFLMYTPLATAIALASLSLSMAVAKSDDWPSAFDFSIVLSGSLLVFGALAVAWAEKNLYSEVSYQFHTMESLFVTTERQLQRVLDRLQRLADEQGESEEFKQSLREAQDRLWALGKEALDENAEWLILHRARPLEPVMAG